MPFMQRSQCADRLKIGIRENRIGSVIRIQERKGGVITALTSEVGLYDGPDGNLSLLVRLVPTLYAFVTQAIIGFSGQHGDVGIPMPQQVPYR